MPNVLELREQNIDEVVRSVIGIGRIGRRSINRALRNSINFTASQIARRVARANRVPVRALTRKGKTQRIFKSRVIAGSQFAAVWVGYNPLPASRVGVPKATSDGTKVGRHKFPGSFIATMDNGFISSFRRTADARRRPAQNLFGITSLPIEEDQVPLLETPGEVASVGVLARARFRKEIIQQLNFELNVRGRSR